jgi:hypothetical protein
MALRVVLYAEGPGEDRGRNPYPPAVGRPLPAEVLGAAHVLIARVLSAVRNLAPDSVQFLAPQLRKARPHVGSDLTHGPTLRKLLQFPVSSQYPQLAIVLVDEDGRAERRRELIEATRTLDLPPVVAVAVREFEAWLIADPKAIREVLDVTETPPSPDSMPPGEAKSTLQNWLARKVSAITDQATRGATITELRASLARQCDLAVLEGLAAFRQLRRDLRDALAGIP